MPRAKGKKKAVTKGRPRALPPPPAYATAPTIEERAYGEPHPKYQRQTDEERKVALAAAEMRPVVRYTPAESRQQLLAVERMLTDGHSDAAVITALNRQMNVGMARIRRLCVRVREKWREEDEDKRAAWKGAQIRRLNRMIRYAMGQQNADGTWRVTPNMSAHARYESLLADIQGTREPLTVSIDVQYGEALGNYIASLTPAQVDELKMSYEETVRLAADAKRTVLIPENVHVNGAAE